uniref:Uncharacterized protein n=1 Tax=Candidatus Kentrum sp. TC TaxID=2126339 RepID=A0A450Z8J2_9GAMM|nr:MAG: hypothetical protein BECKTC1821D_GA0114238_10929 [Candidatus Kentron sp. TC]
MIIFRSNDALRTLRSKSFMRGKAARPRREFTTYLPATNDHDGFVALEDEKAPLIHNSLTRVVLCYGFRETDREEVSKRIPTFG